MCSVALWLCFFSCGASLAGPLGHRSSATNSLEAYLGMTLTYSHGDDSLLQETAKEIG